MSLHQRKSKLDSLLSQIKEVANSEYERGVREALARIVNVAQIDHLPVKSSISKAAKSNVRAPHGAAKALVTRVLRSGPKTIREIREAAKSDTERLVSYQTARLELERGKKEKRYKNQDGKWSLSE